jgi:hypothetical protein
MDVSVPNQLPVCRIYYFTDLDTRELITQNEDDFDYFYDQNDRRWEKGGRLNYVELKDVSDFNQWNTVNISVDKWDLYSSQTSGGNNGIQFLRGEVGFLAFVIRNNGQYASKYGGLYLDNFNARVNQLLPKTQIATITNTPSTNTKVANFDFTPFRDINERGTIADFFRNETTEKYEGNLMTRAREILSLFSTFVHRYELSVRPNGNWFNFANQLYFNFDNYKDDAVSYIDGFQYNIKRNEVKLIAHKGNLQELSNFDVDTQVATTTK